MNVLPAPANLHPTATVCKDGGRFVVRTGGKSEPKNIQYRISNVEMRNRLRSICKSIEFLPSSFDIPCWTFDICFFVFRMYAYAAMGTSSKVTTLNQDVTGGEFPNGNEKVSIWKFIAAFLIFSWRAAASHIKTNILNWLY